MPVWWQKLEQRQSIIDCVFLWQWYCSPRVCSSRPNNNKNYYIEVRRQLRDAVRRKEPQLWASSDCLFHHDNTPAHSSTLYKVFWQYIAPPGCRSPYSSDLVFLALLLHTGTISCVDSMTIGRLTLFLIYLNSKSLWCKADFF